MVRKTKQPTNIIDNSMLNQLFKELGQSIDTKKGVKITKGEALVKTMVDESLKGNLHMMGTILKLAEKLENLKASKTHPMDDEVLSEADEEIILRYYAQNKQRLEAEINKRKHMEPPP